MKSIKKITALATLLAFSCYSYVLKAQNNASQNRTLEYHQKTLKKAQYVFEGTVIKQEAYSNKKGESRTCTVFQIEKIFKGSGQIHLGTIKIITNQGKGLVDGRPVLGKGRYIIIGSQTDSSNLKTPAFDADNSAVPSVETLVEIGRDSYLKGKKIHHDTPIIWVGSQIEGGTLYNTIEELYGFFKENGLTVEEEIKQPDKSNEQGDGIKH
jgi:hypothetical protein